MPFITDFGKPLHATQNGVVVMTIPRYGYWAIMRGRHQCVETSHDIDYLQAKYGPGVTVVPIGDEASGARS